MIFQPYERTADTALYRRRLPHWRQGGCCYFVTWRLADSLPSEKLDEWHRERREWLAAHGLQSPEDLAKLSPLARAEYASVFGGKIEKWLDAGFGKCDLAKPEVSAVIEEALRFFDGERYALGDFVVMPNHVHVLVTPAPDWALSQILHTWKSVTAKAANRVLGKTGEFWQHESFDHALRSEDDLRRYERYIRENPVGLRDGMFRLGRGKCEFENVPWLDDRTGKPAACPTVAQAAGLRERRTQAEEGSEKQESPNIPGTTVRLPSDSVDLSGKPAACPTVAQAAGLRERRTQAEDVTEKQESPGIPGATVHPSSDCVDLSGKPAACPTLSRLKLRHFRCFEHFEAEFSPGTNFIIGPNARGKTSLIEAACVLLRLQSPRVTQLARLVKHGRRGFVADGIFGARHLQFYYSTERRKLALDGVEQGNGREWLTLARAMWFGNEDIELVRGSADKRRRFLDFVVAQYAAGYRTALRGFEHALRSRNHLLKQPAPRWREIEAFDAPLIEHGSRVAAARAQLLAEMQADADAAHHAISGKSETLRLEYVPGDGGDFVASLAAAKQEDARLRQTTIGPHRDDARFFLNGLPGDDASEGQQRTLVLALKLGAARLLERHFDQPPLLLLDDIFGELDPDRRNALLGFLPPGSQRIITTTHLDWMPDSSTAQILRLA